MYSLRQTPVFLAFLNKIIGSINGKRFSKTKIQEQFLIIDRCKCNQSDCATVILKSRTPLKDIDYREDFNMLRGYVHLLILSDYELEVECIYYKDFPHKKEICKLIKKQGEPTNLPPSNQKRKRKLTALEHKKMQRYFKNSISLYERKYKECSDKNATTDNKIFCHIR